jgi:ASPIC and UnbV/FG-GAP-like repeat
LQYADESFSTTYQHAISNNPEWNLVAGDVNNDGWPDIVTSGIIDQVKVLQAVPFSYDYQISTIPDALFFAQGSNIVDADGDGIQDIFVCNDDGLNRLYINEGAGAFVRNDTLIDFNTVPASDNSGNYGSVWTDFDLDGDLDLYISKCRIGVFDPADPRRINVLYVNTDTGYVEMADSFGLAIGAQSWSSDFADIDNDGDLDIIVINHNVQSQLLENTGGGNYADITLDAGIDIIGVTIQSIFRDFDNDGYVDLLVSGAQSKLYRNLGDNTFTEVAAPFGGENISSFTIGDFNSDGFPDVYATYNVLYNTPSNVKDDKIWMNDGNGNNYVRIKAIGTNGNSSAIRARLYLHIDTVTQMREIRAGESYGIGTSLIKNFGLGSATAVDSLVVVWPNGDIESHQNIPVNTTVTVLQGSCVSQVVTLDQGPFVQCGLDTFTINAPDGYDTYLWSNGMVSQSIDVTEPRLYHVSLTDTAGCLTVTSPVIVKPCVWPSEIVYVDSAANGANTGVDWANAFSDLQLALDVADSIYLNIEQIWIATGTYYPTSGLDRTDAFVLVDSIEIYGGFQGVETDTSGRDFVLYPTRLSGDIGIVSDSSDNSYHVIVCPDSVASVRLDGITVQDGLANGGIVSQTRGAAIFCEGKMSLYNATLRNCNGTGNGVYIFSTGILSELVLYNCQLSGTVPDGVSNVNNAVLIIQGVNQIDK